MDERLDRARLLDIAIERTGLDDVGDIPFAEPMDVLIEALEGQARVEGERRANAAEILIALLVKRLRLVADRAANPTIADERIVAPVFIVGLPRTGSTHLHGLLGQVRAARTPTFWEMSTPSPPPEAATADTDPRIAQIQAALDQMPPEMMVRHPMAATRPEQCNLANDWSFLNQATLAYYDIPLYRDHLYNADYAPAYDAHRRTLQQLQWHHPGQWVLKYPKHLMSLDALIATYPDARFVWTHRDPAVVIPSVVSFTGFIRSLATPEYDPKRYGPEWTTLEEFVLRRGLEMRDRLIDPSRVLDVSYHDLMRDPVATIAAVCDHGGLAFDDVDSKAVNDFVDQHPRAAHGEHRYTAEEYGLDERSLRRRFAFYTSRFDIATEAGR